ncbi:uncharacterized protein [Euphorbia lathyris]|uniref:uncharacterized protein n=1 Tax=Euphorbia lathyris TaxID=212925 RepID=UPI00331319BB
MAGNTRYESNSAASPEELGFTGSYPNGQKGNYPTASLDRSGSFREGSESRSFGSGASTPRASSSSEVGSILQYLLLDPITMGDQKYTRSGELRRVLGISLGNAAEDNSFGAVLSKPPPPVATEELKRYQTSILETAQRARSRYKRFNESLLKLSKYCEASTLKKQHRNEMPISERSGTSNFMKMGIQIHRNASDLGTQRLEERNRNVVLNKRVRSSVAESRADSRSNTLPRQQMGKDREILRNGSEGSDLPEEKVRRLPAGGEGWDRKMKRKRSVGSVFARSTDSDGETRRIMHHKLNNEPGLQSYDSQGFSTGSLNGTCGISKLDGSSSPAFSNPRGVLKNESEKASLARDFSDSVNKERLLSKANNKLNFLEDNHTVSPSSVLKGKASRTPRTGCVTTTNSSPNFSRSSAPTDGWEQLPSMTKVNSFGGASNCKRTIPAGPSSPPMAQWVGQRPQKISRTRRANVVSPVSNHDEVQISSEGGQGYPSDFRLTSVGCNGSLLAKDIANGNQLAKVKHERVFSPARLSESEESGVGANHEGRPKQKGISNGIEERSENTNIGPSAVLMKKNKIYNGEDTGDGLRRQGRMGRGASVSRSNISPLREKLESPAASAKPIRNMKLVSEKNGSKSGRPPLKKISDRKSFIRAQTATGGSPDLTVESGDDREELLEAAKYACNASRLCCSSTFWKKMEPFFSSPSSEDVAYLKLQLKSVKELHQSISDMSNLSSNILDDLLYQEDLKSHLAFEENEKCFEDHDFPKKLTDKNLTNQVLENGPSCEMLEGIDQLTPLYQRVLSALIVEDECEEEFEENNEGRNISFQNNRDRPPGDSYFAIEFDPRNKDRMDFHYDSMLGLGFQTDKLSAVDDFSCHGNGTVNRASSVYHNQLHIDDCFQGDQGFLISKLTEFPKYLGDSNGMLSAETNASVISTFDCQYQQTCLEERLLMELQSIGLHLEKVPDLTDGEDEEINQEIIELHRGFLQQVAKKKVILNKLTKTVEESKTVEAGVLEQVALDKLVELAYKKLLATRGSYASKFGVAKVPRQVAVAFMKRALARCRKFGDTAKSCFGEPPLRDVILAAPPCSGNHTESPTFAGLSVQSNMHSGTPNSRHDPGSSVAGSFSSKADDFGESGPLLSRGKKKEVLLDDIGGNGLLRATPCLGNGTKGKRSERERDKDKKDASARNLVAKGGRGTKGDRKTKSKPKQKTAYLSSSGDRMNNKLKDTSSNKKQDYEYNPQNSSKQSNRITEMQDLSVELGIGDDDMGGHQDLSNLFNFEEDGLPENDLMGLDIPMEGLEIPMDDLSELNMLL